MRMQAALIAVFVTFATVGHAAEGIAVHLIRYLAPLGSTDVVRAWAPPA